MPLHSRATRRPSRTATPFAAWAADSGCLGAFDNVPFETGGSGQEFLPFFALDAEFIECGQRMLHKDLPVTFADAESFM
jgi:hypothetical protein